MQLDHCSYHRLGRIIAVKEINDIDKNMETIVAEATPKGRGGVGIVRLSGAKAYNIAHKITHSELKPRYAEFATFYDAKHEVIDQGIALFFKDPHSFTGEDVVELQCHGGPVVIDRLIETALHWGARLARPGEFSERAFLNDKIDLVQAEAISDLIAASSRESARAALRSLQGEFSRKIADLVAHLIHLRVFIEATLDFPDEDIELLENAKVMEDLTAILKNFEAILKAARVGVLLQEGIHLALIGKPNAGKSSLMNALTQRDTAIVSDIPGTTRDVVKEKIDLAGIPIHLLDTAGLRESADAIEQEGVRRSKKALEQADIVLLIIDHQHQEDLAEILKEYKANLQDHTVIVVFNKIDLTKDKAFVRGNEVGLSVKTGEGLALLQQLLLETLGVQTVGDGQFIARRRHLDALQRAAAAVEKGLAFYHERHSLELLAEECRIAQEALSEITGEFRADDLLGAIFSTFCIGK